MSEKLILPIFLTFIFNGAGYAMDIGNEYGHIHQRQLQTKSWFDELTIDVEFWCESVAKKIEKPKILIVKGESLIERIKLIRPFAAGMSGNLFQQYNDLIRQIDKILCGLKTQVRS